MNTYSLQKTVQYEQEKENFNSISILGYFFRSCFFFLFSVLHSSQLQASKACVNSTWAPLYIFLLQKRRHFLWNVNALWNYRSVWASVVDFSPALWLCWCCRSNLKYCIFCFIFASPLRFKNFEFCLYCVWRYYFVLYFSYSVKRQLTSTSEYWIYVTNFW